MREKLIPLLSIIVGESSIEEHFSVPLGRGICFVPLFPLRSLHSCYYYRLKER